MAALEDLAQILWRRGLAGPAVFVLETMRPISFVTAEFLVFLEPFVGAVLPAGRYRVLAEALHDRRKVAWLQERLEQLGEMDAGPQAASDAPAAAPPEAADSTHERPPT